MPTESVVLTGDALRGYTPYVQTPETRRLLAELPQTVKLGLKESPVRPTCLRFEKYVHRILLASVSPPSTVDWFTKAAASIARMYMNDTYGCCVISSFGHRLGVWSANDPDSAGGATVIATNQEITDQYFSVCGPGDNGCYIPRVLDYGIQSGFLAGGKRYKLSGYVSCNWQDKLLVQTCIQLFGTGCIGFSLPQDWLNASVWRPTNSRIVGGHDVALVGFDTVGVVISSWGRLYNFTWEAFLTDRYIGELYFMVPEFLWTGIDGKAPSGVDLNQLKRDMEVLKGGGVPPLPDPNPPPPPPPVGPALIATPNTGIAPLAVSFSLKDVTAGPSPRINYGDGVVQDVFTFPIIHTYSVPGNYTARCITGNGAEELATTVNVTASPPPPPPIPGPPWGVTGRAKGTITVPGVFGRTITVDLPVTGTAQPAPTTPTVPTPETEEFPFGIDSLSPSDKEKLMFGQGQLLRLWGLLSQWRVGERKGIIRDLVERLNNDEDEATLAGYAHEKYGKLSPEQWQNIINLIIQLLPIILALFGGM